MVGVAEAVDESQLINPKEDRLIPFFCPVVDRYLLRGVSLFRNGRIPDFKDKRVEKIRDTGLIQDEPLIFEKGGKGIKAPLELAKPCQHSFRDAVGDSGRRGY